MKEKNSTFSNEDLPGGLIRPVVAIVPAAGKGSRLAFDGPKVLFPINGIPILKLIYQQIGAVVSEFCLVVNPDHKQQIEDYIFQEDMRMNLAVQAEPTGMGDAVLCSEPVAGQFADQCDYLIVWGDQFTISGKTVLSSLQHHQLSPVEPTITFPTCLIEQPYIHFIRAEDGSIASLLQRREGDDMPTTGETDCGIFIVRGKHLFRNLKQHRSESIRGKSTGEFNFLPFIIWLIDNGYKADGLPIADKKETLGLNSLEDVRIATGDGTFD